MTTPVLEGEPGDRGLFGPDSVAWRLHADPVMMIAAIRALLVQALEPRAMAGVDQHSNYRENPWQRLNRTVEFILHTTYGDTATAEAACATVRRIHDHVHGVDPVTGRTYSANDPDLLLWVHAVEVHSILIAYRRFAHRVSDADADRYVAEMARVAELLGLPPALAPRSLGDLRDYLRNVDGLRMSAAARDGMRTILTPPMPVAMRPVSVVPITAAIVDPAPGRAPALPAPVVRTRDAVGADDGVQSQPGAERARSRPPDVAGGAGPGVGGLN